MLTRVNVFSKYASFYNKLIIIGVKYYQYGMYIIE